MGERVYPKYEYGRVTHRSPVLVDGALTLYGFNYITTQRNIFHSLAKRALSEVVVVGQDEQIEALVKHISTAIPGSVATITGPFGSGKTDLVYGLVDKLIASGNTKPEEIHRIEINSTDWDSVNSLSSILRRNSSFADGPVDILSIPPRLIIIEEGERADRETHETAFIMAGLLLPHIPFLIFTGEYTLKDPHFFKLLGIDQNNVYQVQMAPVTADSLKETMRKRMTYLFGDQVKDFDPNPLFDPAFLDFLIPRTNPPIATYREVLMIISELGQTETPRSSEDLPALIDGNLYRSFYDFRPPYHNLKPDVGVFVSRIQELIRNTYTPTSYFQPLSYEQLITLGLYEGLDTKGLEREERRSDRLTSLLRSKIIAVIGDSVLTERNNKERTFLPTVETFLNARYLPLILK